jgi:SlyX protein
VEDRIQELEMKLAFQDDAIEKLTQAVDEQQRALYKLGKELAEVRERLQAKTEENVIAQEDETPPPHY